MAWLVRPREPTIPRQPEPLADHPLAKRLDRDPHPVDLDKLLVRQCRPEVTVLLAYEAGGLGAKGIRKSPLARLSALLRHERRGTAGLVGSVQALNLAHAEA
jgi:hypothetical protein